MTIKYYRNRPWSHGNKIWVKISYNLPCMRDISAIIASITVFRGRAIEWCQSNSTTTEILLQWQPGLVVVKFDCHRSIARPRKPPVSRPHHPVTLHRNWTIASTKWRPTLVGEWTNSLPGLRSRCRCLVRNR